MSEGLETKAEALVKVVALISGCLGSNSSVSTSNDLDKTVAAVLSDGSLIDTDIVSWAERSALTKKEGGRTGNN